MSYILDALEKSDRNRKRGKPPGLNSVHGPYRSSSENRSTGQRTKYTFIAAGLILLISVPSITWYSMKYSSRLNTPAILEETTTKIPTEPENHIPSIPDTAPGFTSSESSKDSDRTPPPPPPITARSKKLILLPDQTKPPQEKETAASLQPRKTPGIPEIGSLPTSMQSILPDLHLSGHTYSDNPAKRMIIINNNILREGDRIDNAIRLIEITWTGVILDYNGEQFAVNTE